MPHLSKIIRTQYRMVFYLHFPYVTLASQHRKHCQRILLLTFFSYFFLNRFNKDSYSKNSNSIPHFRLIASNNYFSELNVITDGGIASQCCNVCLRVKERTKMQRDDNPYLMGILKYRTKTTNRQKGTKAKQCRNVNTKHWNRNNHPQNTHRIWLPKYGSQSETTIDSCL